MFGIGFWELLLLVIVALLVTGPERMPQALNQFAHGLVRARRACFSLRQELQRHCQWQELEGLKGEMDYLDELRESAPDRDTTKGT